MTKFLKKYPVIAFGNWSIEESKPLNSEKIKRLERISIRGINTPVCWKSWNNDRGDEFKMTFPLWLQISAGILTAELAILLIKCIKNRIAARDTDYYSSMSLTQMQELTSQNTRDMIIIGGFGLIFIVIFLIGYVRVINSL